jgi:hypothetical protein
MTYATKETAARKAGWSEGGGYIYDTRVFGSWKEAVSWCGNDGRDEAEKNSRVYTDWYECCAEEGLDLSEADAEMDLTPTCDM